MSEMNIRPWIFEAPNLFSIIILFFGIGIPIVFAVFVTIYLPGMAKNSQNPSITYKHVDWKNNKVVKWLKYFGLFVAGSYLVFMAVLLFFTILR